jgi:hypothetical protein
MTVALLAVCQSAGLALMPDWTGPGPRAFAVRIAGGDVAVWESVDRVGRRMAFMQGTVQRPRSIALVEVTLPADVESHEEGLALLAHHLAPHWGNDPRPQWARDGERWADHLPWRRDQADYSGRPQAMVRRDRIRHDLKALSALAGVAAPDALACFSFDGEILRICTTGLNIAVMAEGKPWPAPAQVPLAPLRHLPKRITQDPLPLDLWDGKLRLGRFTLPIMGHQGGGNAG